MANPNNPKMMLRVAIERVNRRPQAKYPYWKYRAVGLGHTGNWRDTPGNAVKSLMCVIEHHDRSALYNGFSSEK